MYSGLAQSTQTGCKNDRRSHRPQGRHRRENSPRRQNLPHQSDQFTRGRNGKKSISGGLKASARLPDTVVTFPQATARPPGIGSLLLALLCNCVYRFEADSAQAHPGRDVNQIRQSSWLRTQRANWLLSCFFRLRCILWHWLVEIGLVPDDVIAKVNTLITDVNSRPGDQFAYFVLAFPAERADKRLTLLVLFRIALVI